MLKFPVLSIAALIVFALGCTQQTTNSVQAPPPIEPAPITPAPILPKVSSSDLKPLENMILNSNYPTSTKENLATLFLEELRKKYNLSSDELAIEIKTAFKLPSENESMSLLKDIEVELASLRSKVKMQIGIPKVQSGDPSIEFITDSPQLRTFRNEEMIENMKFETARRKMSADTYRVFKTFEDEAKKNADEILAYIAQRKTAALEKEIEFLASLDQQKAQVEALKYAASLTKDLELGDKDSSSSMAGILTEKLTAINDGKENLDSYLHFQIDDTKLRQSALQFSKITKILSRFATKQQSKLESISQQLGQFSKDGHVKIDIETISKDKNLKAEFQKTYERMTDYMNGASELIEIGSSLGLDPSLLEKAQQGLEIADKANTVIGAILSPNPISIMKVASAIFGGGESENPETRRQKEIQTRLDMVLSLQTRTLDELKETRQDIYKIVESVAQTQLLIGKLSTQIAESSQTIYDKLSLMQADVDLIKEMLKSESRRDFAACYDLLPKIGKRSILDVVFNSSRMIDETFSDCLRSASRVNFFNANKMMPFRSVDINDEGDRFARVSELRKSKPFLDLNSLSPTMNFFWFQKTLAAKVDYPVLGGGLFHETLTNSNAAASFIDGIFTVSYAVKVQQLMPYLSILNLKRDGMKAMDLFDDKYFSNKDGLESIEELTKIVNSSIIQLTQMSGMNIFDLSKTELEAINSSQALNCNPSINLNRLECLLQRDPNVRRNFLNYQFYKEVLEKYKNISAYAFLLKTEGDENRLAVMQKSFSPSWDIQFEQVGGQKTLTANVAGTRVSLPGEELETEVIEYQSELKYLLAVREDLVDLLADLQLNSIENELVRRALLAQVIRKAI